MANIIYYLYVYFVQSLHLHVMLHLIEHSAPHNAMFFLFSLPNDFRSKYKRVSYVQIK